MHIRFSIIEEAIDERFKKNFTSILISAGESDLSNIALFDTKTLHPVLEQECSPDNIYIIVLLIENQDGDVGIYSCDEEDFSFKVNIKNSLKHRFTFRDSNQSLIGSVVLLAETYYPNSLNSFKGDASFLDGTDSQVHHELSSHSNHDSTAAASSDAIFEGNYESISLSLGGRKSELIIGAERGTSNEITGRADSNKNPTHEPNLQQSKLIEEVVNEDLKPTSIESVHSKAFKFVKVSTPAEEVVQLDMLNQSNTSLNEEFMSQHKVPRGLDSRIYTALKKNPELVYKKEMLHGAEHPEANGVYEGTWLNTQKHGWGIYTWDDGRVYIGSWSNDRIEGIGSYTWPEFNESQPSLAASNETGKAGSLLIGNLKISEGGKYEGNWKSGQMHGSGKYVWINGASYEGQWKANHIHGKGKFILHDGTVLEGNFVNDRLDGSGMKIFRDGSIYEGDWKCGVYHGKGKFTWSNRSFYEGDWESNKMHGFGTMIKHAPDGKCSSYEGHWLLGKRHGEGKQLNTDGSILEGVWEDDECAVGNYKTPDGETFSF